MISIPIWWFILSIMLSFVGVITILLVLILCIAQADYNKRVVENEKRRLEAEKCPYKIEK